MKEIQTKTGGRPVYIEDLTDIQESALALEQIFKDSGKDFVISGLRITDDGGTRTLSPGFAYLDGKIREFKLHTVLPASIQTPKLTISNRTSGNLISYKDGTSGQRCFEYNLNVVDISATATGKEIVYDPKGKDFPRMSEILFNGHLPLISVDDLDYLLTDDLNEAKANRNNVNITTHYSLVGFYNTRPSVIGQLQVAFDPWAHTLMQIAITTVSDPNKDWSSHDHFPHIWFRNYNVSFGNHNIDILQNEGQWSKWNDCFQYSAKSGGISPRQITMADNVSIFPYDRGIRSLCGNMAYHISDDGKMSILQKTGESTYESLLTVTANPENNTINISSDKSKDTILFGNGSFSYSGATSLGTLVCKELNVLGGVDKFKLGTSVAKKQTWGPFTCTENGMNFSANLTRHEMRAEDMVTYTLDWILDLKNYTGVNGSGRRTSSEYANLNTYVPFDDLQIADTLTNASFKECTPIYWANQTTLYELAIEKTSADYEQATYKPSILVRINKHASDENPGLTNTTVLKGRYTFTYIK